MDINAYSCLAIVAVCLMVAGCTGEPAHQPTAEKISVIDTYHGVDVTDHYRWLENSDPSVREWTDEQNRYTRHILDNIPVRDAIADRLLYLYEKGTPDYYNFHYQAGQLFAIKEDPTEDQPKLVVMASPHELNTERVVVDPNKLDRSGRTSIDFFVVSPDAELVAVSLSVGGSEDGDVHIYRVADGEALPDVIPKVNGPTAGGDVAWDADGGGFLYSRYPRRNERPADSMRFYQQVYYHRMGTLTEEDIYAIGRQFPAIAEIEFETSQDNKLVIAQVANGDGGEFSHYLRDASGKWNQITEDSDMIPCVKFGPDNSLYLLSHKDSPRGKILHLPVGNFDHGSARVVVPESEVVITDFVCSATKLYVTDVIGGPYQIRVIDRTGSLKETVPLLPVSSVKGLTVLDGDNILFGNQSYTEPLACYTYQPTEGAPLKTGMVATSPADFSNVEVIREFATSKDGTRVPMNIIRRKGTVLDGTNPTILYGYGGYGSIQRPYYDRRISLWLDNGGVYVKANLRGGGEFGEEWHKAGYLTNKQNVFDDFAACAHYLIDSGYTKPAKLAIWGGSNGGLLVGATMTQHPDLFRAVVCQKGVLDMIQVETDPNGAFNVTEFGTVTIPEHFEALHAYSPYHSVADSTDYPDVIFTADDKDGRVLAYHSRKMTAAVQAASPNSLTLLRATSGRGHGIGSSLSDDIAMYSDLYAFLFDRLGVQFKTE